MRRCFGRGRCPIRRRSCVIKPRPASNEPYGTLSSLEYRYFREHARSFSHLSCESSAAAARSAAATAPCSRPCSRSTSRRTTSTRFASAWRSGRAFLPEEEDYLSPKDVVVISERVWRGYFASDPGLVGSPIRVGEQLATVVGVTERGFADVRGSIRVDVWLPLTTVGIAYDRKSSADWLRSFDNPRQSLSGQVFGRLRPGVTAAEARAELDVLSRQFRSAAGDGSTRFAARGYAAALDELRERPRPSCRPSR